MKYSYKWLQELSETKLSPEKVADSLTMYSMEVEGLEKTGEEFKNIVVGKILEIKKHPNADKLQLTKIDIGSKKLDIICGAWNIKVGQKVPVALVGAKLSNGSVIKEAEIRGIKSFGMLCAIDELGLGADHSGILILDHRAKVGESVAKYFNTNDSIFEIKVLPNRAHDVMNHVGIAREISVLEGRKFDYDFEGLKLSKKKKSKKLIVKIEDKKLCSRYIGAVMENIEIKTSPDWMRSKLEACGIKSINNVVDATNYVMLELGQPLHAFDIKKISNNNMAQIVVRKAKNKEKLILLDDSIIELNNSDLLITNGETPLALAGIMGGRDSGINKNTKTIVLEAANFNAVNIRHSRTRLGVKTESSDRFEKEIDPNLAEKAMTRIIEILEHTANGKLEGIIDVYVKKIKPWKIKLDLDYLNNLLGEKIPPKEAIKILKLLGIINFRHSVSKNLLCEIPTFRLDLKTQEDLIEEVGRIWGYKKIKIQPITDTEFSPKVNNLLVFERKIKKSLADFGYDEMYNYSFYSAQDAKNCALNDIEHFELANPMNPNQQFVRVSLIPNILKNIKTNLKYFEQFRLFEVGKVYWPNNNAVEEKRMLVMAQVLEKDKNAETFYSIKGATENLLENFRSSTSVSFTEVELLKNKFWHPSRSAEILIDGEKIGMIGEINPIVLGKYKIEKRVAMAEFDTEKLLKVFSERIIYKPLQKFPPVIRDISILAKKETKAIDIQNFIKKIGGNLVIDVKIFDVFVKDNQTSFAYHIEFGKNDRTLKNEEVNKVMEKITIGLEKSLKVKVRK